MGPLFPEIPHGSMWLSTFQPEAVDCDAQDTLYPRCHPDGAALLQGR